MSNKPTQKDIKDYLHLYLGCPIWDSHNNKEGVLFGVNSSGVNNVKVLHGEDVWNLRYESVKPILRPLSDMTEEEAKELYLISPYSKGSWLIKSVTVKENVKGYQPNIVEISWSGQYGTTGYASGTEYLYFNKLNAEQYRWMLSKHFDLFGLIEAGLAFDKSKTP